MPKAVRDELTVETERRCLVAEKSRSSPMRDRQVRALVNSVEGPWVSLSEPRRWERLADEVGEEKEEKEGRTLEGGAACDVELHAGPLSLA